MGTEVLRPHDCLARPIASFRKPNPNPRPKRRPKPQQPVMGHVTILKRGESLVSRKEKEKKKEEERKEAPLVPDPPVFGPDPLGPDPLLVPRRIRLVSGRAGDVYAGSAFAMSPSPRKVPMPSFSRRREAAGCSATEDLRRMLRLD
ncbi:putative serine/Arginine-related protein 53 [Iris pallida]|uniref:Serine/Arginine-related protein 53 n=1 Tax=Iris pallida TaxID=29817 RepID=A0AAX6HEJ0_IRIPA|nr:putative serine/Arginine-related protein 53 [Iris pallida]